MCYHGFGTAARPPAVPPAQWCLSCVDQVFTRKHVILVKSSEAPSIRSRARLSSCTRTVDEKRPSPQGLVAYILRSDPQAVEKKAPGCQEPHGANRYDGLGSPDPMSINVDCVTACVAVARKLHGLLTVGRLRATTAKVRPVRSCKPCDGIPA